MEPCWASAVRYYNCRYDFVDEVSFLVRNCNREIEDSLIEENFSLAEKLYKIQLACSMGVLSNDMNKKYLTGVKYKIKKKEKRLVYY